MNSQTSKNLYKEKTLAMLFIFVMSSVFSVHAQKNAEGQINAVFNQLVAAYGNAKAAPELEIMQANPKPTTPALYVKPVIKVDIQLYKLCQTFGKDSLNALSVVLSHELAHYYYDHSFCSDFAFAIRNKSKEFATTIKLVNKSQKIIYETQADDRGMFYAAIAGYNPFEIQPKILDIIYSYYQLEDANEGYPSKLERKQIAQNALLKSQKLYAVFQEALKAKERDDYDSAMILFEEVNRDFPSRENYSNIGVMKTFKALKLKVLSSEEYHHPQRFLYPLEVDNTSRLNQNGTRGSDEEQGQQMSGLLKSAQKDFQKAISLDANYTIAYINLACVFDLLDNPEAAIGKIKELPKAEQEKKAAQCILAIAYYNADMEEKAEEIWNELEKQF